jgi:hypothetical protein
MSSDTIVRSSSDSGGKSREKYDEESVSSKKKPHVHSVESSSDTESDTPSTEAEKGSNPGRSLRGKIKKAWKNVKEKFHKEKKIFCYFFFLSVTFWTKRLF